MEQKNKNWFQRHYILSSILGLFIVLFIIVNASEDKVGSKKGTVETPAESKIQEEQISKLIEESVKLEDVRIVKNSIGTPELQMKFKNTSTSTVDAIDISVNLYNNFDEPVGKFGSKVEEKFTGSFQDILKPSTSKAMYYNLAVYDSATKFKNLQVDRVHFSDGRILER